MIANLRTNGAASNGAVTEGLDQLQCYAVFIESSANLSNSALSSQFIFVMSFSLQFLSHKIIKILRYQLMRNDSELFFIFTILFNVTNLDDK